MHWNNTELAAVNWRTGQKRVEITQTVPSLILCWGHCQGSRVTVKDHSNVSVNVCNFSALENTACWGQSTFSLRGCSSKQQNMMPTVRTAEHQGSIPRVVKTFAQKNNE